MDGLYPYLQKRLEGAKRIAVLGAGSVLKADDAAGVIVVEKLRDALSASTHPDVLLCIGETAPENYSGKICTFNPTHLLLLDAADVGAKPGEIIEIEPGRVGGPTFCSHMLPLRVMTSYIQDQTQADVILLGIQYQSIAFDGPMTQSVSDAVDTLADVLHRFIKETL